jgi:hypothetical protein
VSAPLAAIVPTAEFPPAIPFTLHVTAVDGLPVPVTFAAKTWAPVVATDTLEGDTLTVTSSSSETVTEALALASATLVAMIFELACVGRTAGAVKRPDAEIVPTLAFPATKPSTLHVTLVFDVPITLA